MLLLFLYSIKYRRKHLNFAIGSVNISFSNFIECRAHDSKGGSITSLVPTFIYRTTFYNGYANQGGCCFILDNLKIILCQFDWCRANVGGCISVRTGKTLISLSQFKRSTSCSHGGVGYISKLSEVNVSHSNCSSCASFKSSCCFSINSEKYINDYSIYAHCICQEGSFALSLENEKSNLFKLLFYHLIISSLSSNSISGILFDSRISINFAHVSNCQFYDSSTLYYGSLKAVRANVELKQNTFSYSLDQEIPLIHHFIIDSSNHFGKKYFSLYGVIPRQPLLWNQSL